MIGHAISDNTRISEGPETCKLPQLLRVKSFSHCVLVKQEKLFLYFLHLNFEF